MLGIAAAVVTVLVVLPVAFLTVRYRSVAGETANAVIVSGFALPGLVLALSIVFFVVQSDRARRPRVPDVRLLVFAYAVHFGSQALRLRRSRWAGCRAGVEDAAQSLGAGRTRRLATVQLPLMRPGLLAGAGLVLLSTMKELPATLILAPPDTETLATRDLAQHRDGLLRAGRARRARARSRFPACSPTSSRSGRARSST